MTVTEAAELMGVSVSTVSRICSGERRPSIDLMYVIEEKLGWKFEDQANEIRCSAYHSEFKKRIDGHA